MSVNITMENMTSFSCHTARIEAKRSIWSIVYEEAKPRSNRRHGPQPLTDTCQALRANYWIISTKQWRTAIHYCSNGGKDTTGVVLKVKPINQLAPISRGRNGPSSPAFRPTTPKFYLRPHRTSHLDRAGRHCLHLHLGLLVTQKCPCRRIWHQEGE